MAGFLHFGGNVNAIPLLAAIVVRVFLEWVLSDD